jgi:hypothetical protein
MMDPWRVSIDNTYGNYSWASNSGSASITNWNHNTDNEALCLRFSVLRWRCILVRKRTS